MRTTFLVHSQLLGLDFLDPEKILREFGTWALWAAVFIVFAECGLLIGFFLPGDSLLFTVGLFISRDFLPQPLWFACIVLTLSAAVGNMCGYWIGWKAGPAIFNRPRSRVFKPEHVEKTHAFFEKYGNRAIVLARFVPIVRTFITVTAGVAKMDFRRYALYTSIGGILWATGVTVLGYYMGRIEFVREHIEAMLVLIVLVSIVPILVEMLRAGVVRNVRSRLARQRDRDQHLR
ncbi:MAG: DedA family protein [Propionibacteriales bacterium]|nr:DedA family protein [Propionibacteriales bacterium]